MEKEVDDMMPARFPIELIKPDFGHSANGPSVYLRTEFGESSPAWLMAEAEAVAKQPTNRWELRFRSIVSRIASFLP